MNRTVGEMLLCRTEGTLLYRVIQLLLLLQVATGVNLLGEQVPLSVAQVAPEASLRGDSGGGRQMMDRWRIEVA